MQVDLSNAQVMKDESGRPFIIVRDQGKKQRQHGNDAVKSHILAAKTVANIVKSSLGPRGLDKILIHPTETSQSQTTAPPFSPRWKSPTTSRSY